MKTVDYIAPGGLADYKEVGRVRRDHFSDTFSAATGVVVEQLLTPDALLAVECMAVLGDDRKETIASTHPRYQKLTYREGVKKGNILCISGTGAAHPVTREIVGVGDVAAQARQIYQNIKQSLEAAGASMADVVQTTDYILTTKDYKETAKIRREFFGDSFPASTGIIVAGLLNPKALIEIDAIAVAGD